MPYGLITEEFMKLILNIVLLMIMALCIWGGFKKGLIGGIIGLISLIAALIGANLLATNYSGQIVPAIDPFVSGFIDSESNTSDILGRLGYGESELSLNDILTQDTSLRYDYAYECLRSVGFYREVSEDLAGDTVAFADSNGYSLTDSVSTVASNALSYVGMMTIAFIMILILIKTVLDMINLDFHLPNVEIVDEVAGAALGMIKGFLYCVLLCWVLGFAGLIIGRDVCDSSALISFFQAFRFITSTLL